MSLGPRGPGPCLACTGLVALLVAGLGGGGGATSNSARAVPIKASRVALGNAGLTASLGSTPAATGANSWDVTIDPAGPAGAWALFEQATDGSAPGTWAEEISVTRDGGRTWADRTPAGLATGSVRRSIAQLVTAGTTDAWVTYGPLGSGSEQRLMASTDGGQHWVSM
ncbi:MAG TPA: hypothetical protein VEJ84_02420, partial [Acidimicrobiales bacterium]|nr:hypothetical protein [Acidimicrobiales bacterium]